MQGTFLDLVQQPFDFILLKTSLIGFVHALNILSSDWKTKPNQKIYLSKGSLSAGIMLSYELKYVLSFVPPTFLDFHQLNVLLWLNLFLIALT